jgi:hypothetical protein
VWSGQVDNRLCNGMPSRWSRVGGTGMEGGDVRQHATTSVGYGRARQSGRPLYGKVRLGRGTCARRAPRGPGGRGARLTTALFGVFGASGRPLAPEADRSGKSPPSRGPEPRPAGYMIVTSCYIGFLRNEWLPCGRDRSYSRRAGCSTGPNCDKASFETRRAFARQRPRCIIATNSAI